MPQPVSQATLAPGTVLSKRYRIEQLIGSGGYASVYRASDLTFGYERAIKEVSDPDPGVRTQFRLEAELLINSKHPNIPHGYHLIEDMGRLFLVMDYVQGKDLEELLNESLVQRQRPLEEAQVLRWAIDICGALIEMHNLQVPVIHRDIKPANIKITQDGRPILIDFGLAKLQSKGPTRTAAQGVSPGFAPPEQYMARGRTDARTDIYGLGATLYACLTGKDPPEAPGRLLAQAGAGGPSSMSLVPPRRLNSRISEETDRIIVRSLELSPANRQQSALQIRDELTTALQKLTAGTTPNAPTAAAVCHRCGTQNRPGAVKCTYCGAPLRTPDESNRPGTPAGLPTDTSGKRPALRSLLAAHPKAAQAAQAAQAANRSASADGSLDQRPGRQSPGINQRSGKQPAVAVDQRTGKQAAPGAEQRTGKQQALGAEQRTGKQAALGANQRTGKQQALGANQRTGKQAALGTDQRTGKQAAASGKNGAAGAKAMPPAATGRQTAVTPKVQPGRTARGVAIAERAATSASARSGAWIQLGSVPLSGFGKFMLALSAIEALWGAFVLVLGSVVIAYQNKPLPKVQLVVGWLIVVVLVSVFGGLAMTRPIYRRGKLTGLRRGFQGFGLALYSIAVHAVAIWGATIFASSQGNATLAIVSFMLFGLSVLVAGVLATLNTLW